jgi:DNA-binding transcriptional regulator YdaS (Cro superfamily)
MTKKELQRCMRGFKRAIESTGTKTELARRLGLSKQALSEWTIIPTDRVVQVEAATHVSRKLLRPDLYEGWEPIAR